MKLSELIRKHPFDTIIPELIAQDPKAESQLAWYKQAYDTLMETTPSEDSWEIEVVRDYDEHNDGTRHEYVHARNCEGQPWDGCLASEVVIKDGLSEISALARILWGMTFYGYTEEERNGRFDDAPRNIYEQKAERLRDRQFRNYAYGLAGPFELEHRSLTIEDWDVYNRREAHRNRSKRMRDARQKRSIARLERAGKVQAAIDRFQPKDRESLEYLFETHQIIELNFASHVQTAGARATYIQELLTNYYRGDLSNYTHCEVLLTTSSENLVTDEELRILSDAFLFIMPHTPSIRHWLQIDDALNYNIKLFLILSR